MKLARVQKDGRVFHAVLRDGRAFCLAGSLFENPTETGESWDLDDVRLLAPVEPPNILCVGLNYRSHASESGHAEPDHPVLFLKATTSLCGPDDDILPPGACH